MFCKVTPETYTHMVTIKAYSIAGTLVQYHKDSEANCKIMSMVIQ